MWDELVNFLQRIFGLMAMTSDDVVNILVSLIVSIVIGVIISQTYKLTHRGVNFESTFMTSLIMLAPIVSVVMFFIQGNLVLSLGLVGSLSIIRFRTPIKDTRDMVYLFWVIAVGLGAGIYNWGTVILSSLVILILIIVLFFIKYGRSQNSDYVLVLSGKNTPEVELIGNVIQQFAVDAKMRSQSIDQDMWEIVYELHLIENTLTTTKIIEELKNIGMVTNVSLLAPQLALPA